MVMLKVSSSAKSFCNFFLAIFRSPSVIVRSNTWRPGRRGGYRRFSPLALRPAVSGGLPLHLFSRGSPRRDISAPSALLHKAEDPVPDLPDAERFHGPLTASADPHAAAKTTS